MSKQRQGYTLIEILVALAIFSILLGYSIINLRGTDDRDKVRLTTDKIASLVRTARNAGFNGVPHPSLGVFPTGGYGVYFNRPSKQYIYFADINNNDAYAADEMLESFTLDSSLTMSLAGDIAIQSMVIIFNGDAPPVVKNAGSGLPILTSRQIDVSGPSGCSGRTTLSDDDGPLFVEAIFTNC